MAGTKKPTKKYNPNKVKVGLAKASIRLTPFDKLTSDEILGLKAPPNLSMKLLQAGQATATDWYNISLRIMAGLETSKVVYTEDTVKQFDEAVKTFNTLRERYVETGKWLLESKEEADNLSSAIYAVDEMQDTVSRSIQLYALRKSQKYMSRFL